MPSVDRSRAQTLREREEEKRFLKKIRHRAIHPDHRGPILFRLAGYVVRLVILAVVVTAILFLRNRSYFNGESFSNEVQTELDHYFDGEDSKLQRISWASDQAKTSYRANGGPGAFFRQIDLQGITARAKWRKLLISHSWELSDVEISEANIFLKGGQTPRSAEDPPKERVRSGNWLKAAPDFSRARYGEITLHKANIHWGPFWTSKGSAAGCRATLRRRHGEWKLSLFGGTVSQNWLRNLEMDPDKPLEITLTDNQINIHETEFRLGEAGQVTLKGTIRLGETPDFDLQVSMKTIDLRHIVPDEFYSTLGGLVDITMKVTGSPNTSAGIIFEGELSIVQLGRLRNIPILRTLSTITPRTDLRLMPVRSGSSVKFKTRKGVLHLTDISIQGGATLPGGGLKNDQGEAMDAARVLGHLTYQMDTTELESSLRLESLSNKEEDQIEEPGPEVGFNGEVRIGMPWVLLDKNVHFREKYFTKDNRGYGWITVPLEGLIDEISASQARNMDIEWVESAEDPRRS